MTLVTASFGLTLRDARGHTGKSTLWYTYDNVDAAHVFDAYNACITIANGIATLSNGAIARYNGLIGRQAVLSYGGTGTYVDAEDKAKLTWQLINPVTPPVVAGIARLEVPACKSTMFLADQETVDPNQAAVDAFLDLLESPDASGGFVSSKTGLLFGTFIGGTRVRRKFQRKITIYDKSANLDEPDE